MATGPLIRLALNDRTKDQDWRTANSTPEGLAPRPELHSSAIVQVYAANTYGWRGAFADHCWIAIKPAGARVYQRYEVIGWNLFAGRPAITETETASPDRKWFGATPRVLRD